MLITISSPSGDLHYQGTTWGSTRRYWDPRIGIVLYEILHRSYGDRIRLS